jgi:hypothetical protein
MGLFDWLRGGAANERDAPRHHPPPIPSKAGVGPDNDAERVKTQTETGAWRVSMILIPGV